MSAGWRGQIQAQLVRGKSAEYVLEDLAEEAAARIRAGESPKTGWPPRGLMVETRSAMASAPVVQRHVAESVPGLRYVAAVRYRDIIDPTYRAWKLGAMLFAGFGLLALIVASIGLCRVLAFDVTERRPEMGLRAALGATRHRIVRHVLADGGCG